MMTCLVEQAPAVGVPEQGHIPPFFKQI